MARVRDGRRSVTLFQRRRDYANFPHPREAGDKCQNFQTSKQSSAKEKGLWDSVLVLVRVRASETEPRKEGRKEGGECRE